MPTVLSELEKILNRVVHQFLDFKKTTQRRELLREFESPGAIDKLASIGMLQATAATNYLPSGIAFYYCNDPEVQALTRRGVRAVAYVLKNLIKEVSPNLERSNIERLAREFDKDADEKVIRAGLYVASELGLFQSSRGKNDEEVDVIPLRINEYIYEKDPQSLRDARVRARVPKGFRNASIPAGLDLK